MLAECVLQPEQLSQRWAQLARQSDTPDYYEINEFGELIMSPRPTNDHQRVVQATAFALANLLGPEVVTEVSVLTDRGVRVPDVAWMPSQRWAAFKGKTPLPEVPDLCVEVLSPGNTAEEITMKTAAYLRGGAKEGLVVRLNGDVEILGPEGLREASVFGIRLELPAALF